MFYDNQVASSLNSSYCYILQSDSTVYTWLGSLTTSEDQELVERQLDLIKVCASQLLLTSTVTYITEIFRWEPSRWLLCVIHPIVWAPWPTYDPVALTLTNPNELPKVLNLTFIQLLPLDWNPTKWCLSENH